MSPRLFLVAALGTFAVIQAVSPLWRDFWPGDVVFKYMVLFIAVPLLVAGLSGRIGLLGLRLGNHTFFFTVTATLTVLPFYVGAALLVQSVRDYYPMWAFAPDPSSLLKHFLLIAWVILGTEILFRGLMVLALREYGLVAVLLHLIPYVYIHFSKPVPEVLASAAAGLFWGVLDLKSDSIIPSTVSHTVGFFVMDLIIVLRTT